MNLRKDHYRRCSLGRERVAREPWPPTTAGDARRALGGGGRGWPGPARASPAWTRGEAIKAGILWRSTTPQRRGVVEATVLPAPLPLDDVQSPRPRDWSPTVAVGWVKRVVLVVGNRTTSNGGPLGSCIDEERRELRYLV